MLTAAFWGLVGGIALVLDLSQSLGAMPARIAAWQPAFVVSVGYKWLLGPGGLAYLWVAPAWRDRGEAIEQHWRARDPAAVWREDPAAEPPYRAGARRYDAGEVPSPLRLAMAEAALRQIHAWRIERIAAALQSRVAALVRALRVDLASGEGFARLPRRPEALVFCAAPDRRDEAAYRALYVDGLRRLLGPGGTAAPERESLALLPSGPDAVRTLSVRGTRPVNTSCADPIPMKPSLGRRSVPLERISGSGNRCLPT